MPSLIVYGGEQSGRVIDLQKDNLIIGHAPACDVVLAGNDVAPQQARIVARDGIYWLQALHYGVFVGRRPVIQQPIGIGDEFNIAAYRFCFSDDEAAPQAENIQRSLHNALINQLDLKRLSTAQMADKTLRRRAEEALDNLIHERPLTGDVAAIKKSVLDATLGLGPLEPLMADESITEIMVNSPNRIYVERRGKLELVETTFMGKEEVLTTIERIVGPLGKRIDESSPMVDARLPDGSRVHAIISPLALDGPVLTIRKFPRRRVTIDDYLAYGSLSAGMADFLRLSVRAAKNMIIAGGTGTGKTTLLNILSGFIPEGERLITIEDSAELQLKQAHVVRLETRPNNIEGKGEVAIRELVRNALRMRPNRIIVGECRGPEALDMLQAMNTGHEGSLTTIHANSPVDALRRLENLVLLAGMELPLKAVRELIYSSIHIIVQLARCSDGGRRVKSISEICGFYEGEIQIQEIFKYDQRRHIATGVIPNCLADLAILPSEMSIFVPEWESK